MYRDWWPYDSYLGEDNGRLIVDVAEGTESGRKPAGLVSRLRTDPDPLLD